MITFIETRHGLSVFARGEMREVPKTHADYDAIREMIKADEPDVEDKIVDTLSRAVNAVKKAVAAAPASGVTFEDGQVKFNGEPIHNTLTERMLRMIDEGFSVTPLVNFLVKLMQSPSFRVVNSLYDFLEHGKIPITEDGDFLAYKSVRNDWKDIYSGTIDNSIGQVVQVPRNKVDENPEATCSYGLHVCSWDYLPHFQHAGGHVVIVKVNPADVVAIPSDYNNTKMRVCRYEVIGEHKDYYSLTNRSNVLADRSVFSSSSFGFQEEDGLDDADDYDDDDNDWDRYH